MQVADQKYSSPYSVNANLFSSSDRKGKTGVERFRRRFSSWKGRFLQSWWDFSFLEYYICISENHFLINIICTVLTELEINGKVSLYTLSAALYRCPAINGLNTKEPMLTPTILSCHPSFQAYEQTLCFNNKKRTLESSVQYCRNAILLLKKMKCFNNTRLGIMLFVYHRLFVLFHRSRTGCDVEGCVLGIYCQKNIAF